MTTKKIFVVGDSHSFFWNGKNHFTHESVFKGIEIVHCGPATAFNLMKVNSNTNVLNNIIPWLDVRSSEIGCLILCFGEIDIRVHAVASAIRSGCSLEDSIKKIFEKYLEFIDFIKKRYKCKILLWGPVASIDSKISFNSDYPAVGSNFERNYATKLFNNLCTNAEMVFDGLYHFTIIDELLDRNLDPHPQFMWDGSHLNTTAMILAIPKLTDVLVRAGLEKLISALEPKFNISQNVTLRNVAAGADYKVTNLVPSSPHRFFDDTDDGHAKFLARHESPKINIVLGSAYILASVSIIGARESRILSGDFIVSVSKDDILYEVVARVPANTNFLHNNEINIPLNLSAAIRFIEVQLVGCEIMELCNVKVMAYSFIVENPL